MPSASKSDNKASAEAIDPIKQAIQVLEKKARNLEKRKGKLDGYRQKQREGNELNKDQEEAVLKYDIVVQNLEFAHELQKQFTEISVNSEKLAKKQMKREKIERQATEIKRMGTLLQLQGILDSMGSETARADFGEGKNGAVQLSEENLSQLDELYKLISPTRETENSYQDEVTKAAEHITNFLEAKDKEVIGTTYKALHEMIEKIAECGYFDQVHEEAEEEQTAETEEKEDEGTEKEVVEEVQPEIEHPQESALPVAASAQEEPVEIDTFQIPQSLPSEPVQELVEPEPEQPKQPEPEVDDSEDAVYANEDDSFFTTTPFPRHRPFQEIVSSVQGTFDFLQDSEINLEAPPHIDPAVVAAKPMTQSMPGSQSSQATDSTLSQQQSFSSRVLGGAEDPMAQQSLISSSQPQLHSNTQSLHGHAQPQLHSTAHGSTEQLHGNTQQLHGNTQQLHGNMQQLHGNTQTPTTTQQLGGPPHTQTSSLVSPAGPSSLDTYSSTGQDYSQTLMSQGLLGSSQSSGLSFGDVSSLGVMEQSLVGSTGISSSSPAELPPAIPLPSQTSLQSQQLGQPMAGADHTQNSQEKKPFTMNPNAAMFESRSSYGQAPVSMSLAQMQQQQQQTNLTDDTKYGQHHLGGQPDYQQSNTFGGNNYGRGPSSRGSGPPRGGRGGNRGGMPNGFSRGSRGGSSGSSGPYNTNRGTYNNSRGGMRGSGPPRGNNMRGGTGGRGGGFGGPRSGNQQNAPSMQQTAA